MAEWLRPWPNGCAGNGRAATVIAKNRPHCKVAPPGLRHNDCSTRLTQRDPDLADRCGRGRRNARRAATMLAELQQIGANNLFKIAKLTHGRAVHLLVNLDQRNGFTASFLAAKMEGGDVDAMPATQRSQIANKTGLVIIAKIQKAFREIRLDRQCPGLRQCGPCHRQPACRQWCACRHHKWL